MGFSFTTPMIIGSIILVLVIIIFIYRNYLSTSNEIDKVVDDANTAADEANKAADTANKTATTEEEKDAAAASSKAAQESVNAATDAKTAADTAKKAETVKVTTKDPQEAEEAAIVQEVAEKQVVLSTTKAANKAAEAQIAAVNASPDKTYECANDFASGLDGLEVVELKSNSKMIFTKKGNYLVANASHLEGPTTGTVKLEPRFKSLTRIGDSIIYEGDMKVVDATIYPDIDPIPVTVNVDTNTFLIDNTKVSGFISNMSPCLSYSPDKTYECANDFASGLDGLEVVETKFGAKLIFKKRGDYLEANLSTLKGRPQTATVKFEPSFTSLDKDPLVYKGNMKVVSATVHPHIDNVPVTLDIDNNKFITTVDGRQESASISRMPTCFS